MFADVDIVFPFSGVVEWACQYTYYKEKPSTIMHTRSLNIGFVSTRFAGTDGVSLESEKWAQVLEEFGHTCYWFAGVLDKEDGREMSVPEAFFNHPDNL